MTALRLRLMVGLVAVLSSCGAPSDGLLLDSGVGQAVPPESLGGDGGTTPGGNDGGMANDGGTLGSHPLKPRSNVLAHAVQLVDGPSDRSAIRTDANGIAHIARWMWLKPSAGLWMTQHSADAGSSDEIVDPLIRSTWDVTFEMDSAGRAHLLYDLNETLTEPYELAYAVRDASGWRHFTVELGMNGVHGGFASRTIDRQGNLHIVAAHRWDPKRVEGPSKYDLYYWRISESAWSKTAIASGVRARDARIVADANAKPTVVYGTYKQNGTPDKKHVLQLGSGGWTEVADYDDYDPPTDARVGPDNTVHFLGWGPKGLLHWRLGDSQAFYVFNSERWTHHPWSVGPHALAVRPDGLATVALVNASSPWLYYAYENAAGGFPQLYEGVGEMEDPHSIQAQPSIDVGPAGHIRTSYYSQKLKALRVALHYDQAASYRYSEPLNRSNPVGEEGGLALAIDPAGRPHLAYDDNLRDLKYARWDGTRWSVERIEASHGASDARLVLDSQGNPHIAAHYLGTQINYLTRGPNGWVTEKASLATPAATVAPSLAVDDANAPHVTYLVEPDYREANPGLYYSRRDAMSNTWVHTQVLKSSSIGPKTPGANRLRVDAARFAHLVFTYDGCVYYWTSKTNGGRPYIDDIQCNTTASDASLALDAQGRPHVIWTTSSNVVFYAGATSSPTQPWTLEKVSDTGCGHLLSFDPVGNPVVHCSEGQLTRLSGQWKFTARAGPGRERVRAIDGQGVVHSAAFSPGGILKYSSP